jgi:hypothetical protein
VVIAEEAVIKALSRANCSEMDIKGFKFANVARITH